MIGSGGGAGEGDQRGDVVDGTLGTVGRRVIEFLPERAILPGAHAEDEGVGFVGERVRDTSFAQQSLGLGVVGDQPHLGGGFLGVLADDLDLGEGEHAGEGDFGDTQE